MLAVGFGLIRAGGGSWDVDSPGAFLLVAVRCYGLVAFVGRVGLLNLMFPCVVEFAL